MTRAVLAFLRVAVVLAVVSCESTPAAATPSEGTDAVASSRVQRGIATYYADSLAGHKTASGERYDPHELTAAHRSLPFGTIVEVERKDGRKVRVRINDRGPYGKKSRIIDLSRRAAEEIGLVRDGVARVTVTIVR